MCFDNALKEGPEPATAKDSLAELLFEISVAEQDDDEGDAQEDDMGDAMADDNDEGMDPVALFRDAQRANARENNINDDEDEISDDDLDQATGTMNTEFD